MHIDDTTALVPSGSLDDRWADTLGRLRAFVAARVDDRELAADITQDVIVRSIASGALDRVDNPAAWLYRSARNAVIDHYRTRRSSDPLTDLDAWPDPDGVDDRPNEATRELSRCLQPLLDQMAPAAREALVRVDVDGQTQQRAAHDLGISVSGMKSRACSALAAISRHCSKTAASSNSTPRARSPTTAPRTGHADARQHPLAASRPAASASTSGADALAEPLFEACEAVRGQPQSQ